MRFLWRGHCNLVSPYFALWHRWKHATGPSLVFLPLTRYFPRGLPEECSQTTICYIKCRFMCILSKLYSYINRKY
jgi:hypothetical protein